MRIIKISALVIIFAQLSSCYLIGETESDTGSNDVESIGETSDTTTGHRDTDASCWIDYLFPERTWPGCPIEQRVEIIGGGFDSDAVVVWNTEGDSKTIYPLRVDQDSLEIVLPAALLSKAVDVQIAVEQTEGGRCAAATFHFGGVLPDTGQTRCYDDDPYHSIEIGCSLEAPAEFAGQDAQFGWDRHLAQAQRFKRSSGVEEPIVSDRVTQLIWEGCAAGLSGDDCSEGTLLALHWSTASGYCEDSNWGGYEDWRLPAIPELVSLVNLGLYYPAANADVFPGMPQNDPDLVFWSSSPSAVEPEHQQTVNFGRGSNFQEYLRDEANHIRCVRGGVPSIGGGPFKTAILSGERIVRDLSTGLSWQGCAAGLSGEECEVGLGETMTWRDALAYCNSLVWGEYSDWRLPSSFELWSLVDQDSVNPALPSEVFPEIPLDDVLNWFWSSTSSARGPEHAWELETIFGYMSNNHKWVPANVLCVRGGM